MALDPTLFERLVFARQHERAYDFLIALLDRLEAKGETAALRLIEDDALRVALSRQILEKDPYKAIFDDPSEFYPNDYLELFSWVYDHHEQMEASEKRVWTWEDRQAIEET